MTLHQQRQVEIINQIEQQIATNSLQATAVVPVNDFDSDNRICLTSIHFPQAQYVNSIYSSISEPLMKVFPEAYYYSPSSLHLTIKNIQVIDNPPTFSESEIEIAKKIFSFIIPQHHTFTIYPYRLLIFKNNIALMSTTDEELDNIILDLDCELERAGLPDNKKYANKQYFFSNMTLARFSTIPPKLFIEKVRELSSLLTIPAYRVDSVSLISSNAVMKKMNLHGKWNLLI